MSRFFPRHAAVFLLFSVLSCAGDGSPDVAQSRTFPSRFLGEIVLLPGVATPSGAENRFLPWMEQNAGLFDGKSVLEIGTGSGAIALYAAKLGAERVVATAVDEAALRNTELNAKRLGVASVVEARRVPASDVSAYSALRDGERFDFILANPPHSLDLDAGRLTAETDDGSIGPSLVRGLDRHLEPGGVAVLYYGSLFYHDVMVKYARHAGFDVRHHGASKLLPLQSEILFNDYLGKLLRNEGLEASSFRFHRDDDRLGCIGVDSPATPLLGAASPGKPFYGMMVIRRIEGGVAPTPANRPNVRLSDDGTLQDRSRLYNSTHFDEPIVNLTGVFDPLEAEQRVLPFMKINAELFRGKSVLEIGTGTGMISLFAARLGAARVVATDINEKAIENANLNAQRQSVASVIETRLVSLDDMSAFSVIGAEERFDIIISNPPYSLDLLAPTNTAVADTGDLGPSIVRGLDRHLTPDGMAILYYNSLFYHDVMVKFARHEGFTVRNHGPSMMTPVEMAALFNSYLRRLLDREGLEPTAFDFVRNRDVLGCFGLDRPVEPLFAGNPRTPFPGFMVIRRADPSR